MKVVETHYIEKIYNHSQDSINGGVEICRVKSRDPLAVEEEKDLVGFRFFDAGEGVYKNGHRVSLFSPRNYSGMYYFGKRLTYKDLFFQADKDPIKKLQLDYLNRYGIDEAIFCERAGKTISCINENDKTVDEVKLAMVDEKASSIFISHRQFFDNVICCIEEHEWKENGEHLTDVIISESVCPLCDMDVPNTGSISAIIRTYDLYVRGNKEISFSTIMKGGRMGCLGEDTYFSLRDALNAVKPLYQDYPYLEEAMYNMKLAFADERDNASEVSTGKVKSKAIKNGIK